MDESNRSFEDDLKTIAAILTAGYLRYVTRARITQIMNLLLLAPDIQERILLGLGRGPHGLLATFRVTRLAPRPTFKVARAAGRRTARAAGFTVKPAIRSTASAIPGTVQWRHYVERGQSLDFAIVAEQSLPVLRAYGVPLAMASQRPRGKALVYDLQTGRLSPGVVAQGVVVREVVGLPAEFDRALRDAEIELGFRPRVWALYPGDLFAVLRSLTEDALKQQGVSVDSVQEARVRMSLAGGRAFTVTLVGHS